MAKVDEETPPALAGGWRAIYRELLDRGLDEEAQRRHSAWLDPVLELAGPAAGRRALDLGCGLGADLRRLNDEGWHAEGLDGEATAADFVATHYGIPVTIADLGAPLSWPDAHFGLVVSRLALHVLAPAAAAAAFAEVARVLEPGGLLAFVVNAVSHRECGLQYDYRGAVELEPGYWHLPSLDRRYLFYTPERARAMLGRDLSVSTCEEREIDHWGIRKRVVTCVARRRRVPG